MKIPIAKIRPNPNQPRKVFEADALEELAESMASPSGQIQPIVVEPEKSDIFILVDGERRLRAATLLGWTEIEAHVREDGQGARGVDALIANVQREDLKPSEEGRAYKQLLEQLGTQEAVARRVGVSTPTVALRLYIAEFDERIQRFFDMGRLPMTCGTLSALKKLPSDLQFEVASKAAMHNVNEVTLKRMCKQVIVGGKPAYAPKPRVNEPYPIMPKAGEHFNALALLEHRPADVRSVNAVIATCRECALYNVASPRSCRECPLVDYLKRLS